MPQYVTLYNWTDKGATSVKDTVNRYQAAKQLAESVGGKLETTLWTIGPYDLVGLAEFPDDETGQRQSPSRSPRPAPSAQSRCAHSTRTR